DGDFALVGLFESDVHDAFLSIVNIPAVTNGNNHARSRVLDKGNAPITNSKPAPGGALQPLHIARSVSRIDGQFGVNTLADVRRKLAPMMDRSGREENRFQ